MEFACSVPSPNASQIQQTLWWSTLSALRGNENINQCLLALITRSSRPGGRGVLTMTLIKASNTVQCQRELLILRSKLHQNCFFYFLLLLSRHGLVFGPRNPSICYSFARSKNFLILNIIHKNHLLF